MEGGQARQPGGLEGGAQALEEEGLPTATLRSSAPSSLEADTERQEGLIHHFHYSSSRWTRTPTLLTVQRGQIHSPLGISGSGGLRQWMWYDEGHESQQSSSPPSLQTLQNSMWWSSSSISPASPLSSSPSEASSRASHWMPSFSCGSEKRQFPLQFLL